VDNRNRGLPTTQLLCLLHGDEYALRSRKMEG
jgi:hypothetical protein